MSKEKELKPKFIIDFALKDRAMSIWLLVVIALIIVDFGIACMYRIEFITSMIVAGLFAAFEGAARRAIIRFEPEDANSEKIKRAHFAVNFHGVMFLLAMFASVIIYRMCIEQIL